MLMGLNLLSQPAQALSFGFSFANLGGTPPTGANQLITGTIDGLVEGNNTGAGVTATVLSTPNNQLVGSYSFSSTNGGSPNAFVVTNGNITFVDALFTGTNVGLLFGSAGVNNVPPNGGSMLTNGFSDFFFDGTQPATFTAVPWETDALPVIGSTVLFGVGLWTKRKFAKPLQK